MHLFRSSHDRKSTRHTIVIKLHADVCPYACENFRRLAALPCAEGGFVGGKIDDIKPTIHFNAGTGGGKGKPRSKSAFGGTSFEDESDGELDHHAYAVGMRSGKLLPAGQFGSEWYICGSSCEEGSTAAAMLDQSEGHMVFGKVIEGTVALELLESLMACRRWLNLQAQQGNTGAISASTSPGGPPAVPVVIRQATVIPWTKEDQRRVNLANLDKGLRRNVFDIANEAEDGDNMFDLARSGALAAMRKHGSMKLKATKKVTQEAPIARRTTKANDELMSSKSSISNKFRTAPINSSIGKIGKLKPSINKPT